MTREEIIERLEYLNKVIDNGYDTAFMQRRMSHPNADSLADSTMRWVKAFERERNELREKIRVMETNLNIY